MSIGVTDVGLLDGKVAIVTGAGRGIGRSEALLLAAHGANVVVNDVGTSADGGAASAVVATIEAAGGHAVASPHDVGDFVQAEQLVQAALDAWGRLDVLVNNAGIIRDRMIYNLGEDDWDEVIRVHLKGHFATTRHACAHWREVSKQTGGPAGGRIVNTTSFSGLLGNIAQASYGAAKAAIAAFTQIVSLDMARYGVTANAVAPLARTRISTGLFDPDAVLEGFDAAHPDNIAPLVVALASEKTAAITGQVFFAFGGEVELYAGWHPVASLHRDRTWDPGELAAELPGLFTDRPLAYAPDLEAVTTSLTQA